MAEIAMWLRKTKLNKPNRKPNQPNCPKPIRSLFFVSWVCMPNFSFLGYAYVAFPPKIAILLRKTKPTKPNQKPNQPSCLKPLGLSYFCELSLHTKFQLPRFCLSCISMVEDGKKRRRKEESAVLMATLATAQVELSLSWGWG